MDDFAGKVAVVTGGASGIGRAIVKELLASGAKVVVADVEQKALDNLLAEFDGAGEIMGVVTDVSDGDSVAALADKVYANTALAICYSTTQVLQRRLPMYGRQPSTTGSGCTE